MSCVISLAHMQTYIHTNISHSNQAQSAKGCINIGNSETLVRNRVFSSMLEWIANVWVMYVWYVAMRARKNAAVCMHCAALLA
jgi:hypothetical protein